MPKKQDLTQNQEEQTQDKTAEQVAQAQEMPPMYLDVRVRPISPKGNLLGYASVNINGCFAVDGIKVMTGKHGLFATMPSYQDGKGNYRDVCFPVTKEFHGQLNQAVVTGYQQTIEQMQTASNEAQQRAQAQQQEAPEMAQAMSM